jgi:DNA-binding protein HU-beta
MAAFAYESLESTRISAAFRIRVIRVIRRQKIEFGVCAAARLSSKTCSLFASEVLKAALHASRQGRLAMAGRVRAARPRAFLSENPDFYWFFVEGQGGGEVKPSSLMATTKTQRMTKTQLQTTLAAQVGTDKKTAIAFLDALVEIAYRETKKRGEFVLPGIGKLVKQKRKARTGINPKTGEKIKIAAKTVVKVRVAKAAKDAVLAAK